MTRLDIDMLRSLVDHAGVAIVALGASAGHKVRSRIDPLGIQGNVPIYHRKDNETDWTINVEKARQEKGIRPRSVVAACRERTGSRWSA